MYYKTLSEHYEEYKMIGNPLTELYLLESISDSNSINYFERSIYDKLTENSPLGLSIKKGSDFCVFNSQAVTLKGVGRKTLHNLKRVDKNNNLQES